MVSITREELKKHAMDLINDWINRGDEEFPLVLMDLQLEEYPENIPDNVKYLVLDDNYISHIPSLPSGLITLNIFGNKLMSLPELPSTLRELDCDCNLLKRLPTLPPSLRILDCRNNDLLSYPGDGELIAEYNERLQAMQNIFFSN